MDYRSKAAFDALASRVVEAARAFCDERVRKAEERLTARMPAVALDANAELLGKLADLTARYAELLNLNLALESRIAHLEERDGATVTSRRSIVRGARVHD